MDNAIKQTVILIPALEPDERLVTYVHQLMEKGFGHIVVIDDGSGADYRPIFESATDLPDVSLLRHEVNKGKGAALKTGYAYVKQAIPDAQCILTADSDGQHTVTDCVRIAEAVAQGESGLYLGSRDFSLPEIPPKSRFGNRCTSVVFKLLYGSWLPDTQTGLRAFRREDLDFMMAVEGERYEYEMNVLIACARAKKPFRILTIETVYENNNAGTHFHPIRDSWRIYKVLLGSFFKFTGTALICWVIDQGLAGLLAEVLLPLLGMIRGSMSVIQASGIGARCVSAVVNYILNRQIVFRDKRNAASSLWKYILLAVACILVSNLAVWLFVQIGLPRWLGKIIADVVLYFVNFKVQNIWVFASKGDKNT